MAVSYDLELIMLSSIPSQMELGFYSDRERGWHRTGYQNLGWTLNPPYIPSLVRLASAAYYPEPEVDETYKSLLHPLHKVSKKISLCLERRLSPPEHEFLNHPPRYNRYQWRMVWWESNLDIPGSYINCILDDQDRAISVECPGPRGGDWVGPSNLHKQFRDRVPAGVLSESYWHNEIDLNLQELHLQSQGAIDDLTFEEQSRINRILARMNQEES